MITREIKTLADEIKVNRITFDYVFRPVGVGLLFVPSGTDDKFEMTKYTAPVCGRKKDSPKNSWKRIRESEYRHNNPDQSWLQRSL